MKISRSHLQISSLVFDSDFNGGIFYSQTPPSGKLWIF